MKRARLVISAVVLPICCAACRGTQGPRVEPSTESAPEVAWRDKTVDQRRAHMASVVLPLMRAAFQRFDSERFAAFDCRSCHGAGADDKSFRMPNPDLPRLPGAADGFEKLLAEKEKVTTFMANLVVPAMAPLLGEKPYGPDSRDGFGCFRCHVTRN